MTTNLAGASTGVPNPVHPDSLPLSTKPISPKNPGIFPPDSIPHLDTVPIPSDEEILDRFRPLLAGIAEGAARRDAEHLLPVEEIQAVREAGFPRLRIPVAQGGLGATPSQLVRVIIALASADSNVPHSLRGHCAFVEERLRDRDEARRQRWFERIVGGATVGNAQAERGPATGTTSVLEEAPDGYLLSGTKYYTTGTLYADYTITSAKLGDEQYSVVVATKQPGVEVVDDWDGFGQRLTASGTARFSKAHVDREDVFPSERDDRVSASGSAFFQLVLLSVLAGIARNALTDAVAFTRAHTRTFGVPGQSSPREDPLVQRVVGRLSSLAFGAEEVTLAAARRFDAIDAERRAGRAADGQLHTDAQLATFRAQQLVPDLVLEATTTLFEVGGASATGAARNLDRHWRNARTLASHNPKILRERMLGDFELNDRVPVNWWVKS